jgi:hypothetical protein
VLAVLAVFVRVVAGRLDLVTAEVVDEGAQGRRRTREALRRRDEQAPGFDDVHSDRSELVDDELVLDRLEASAGFDVVRGEMCRMVRRGRIFVVLVRGRAQVARSERVHHQRPELIDDRDIANTDGLARPPVVALEVVNPRRGAGTVGAASLERTAG